MPNTNTTTLWWLSDLPLEHGQSVWNERKARLLPPTQKYYVKRETQLSWLRIVFFCVFHVPFIKCKILLDANMISDAWRNAWQSDACRYWRRKWSMSLKIAFPAVTFSGFQFRWRNYFFETSGLIRDVLLRYVAFPAWDNSHFYQFFGDQWCEKRL